MHYVQFFQSNNPLTLRKTKKLFDIWLIAKENYEHYTIA